MGRFLAFAIVLSIPASWVCTQVWPVSARDQFAAHLAASVCSQRPPPPECSPKPGKTGTPLLNAIAGRPATSVPSGPGVTYSFAQLVQALEGAGVPPGARSHTGAAIARAESGGRSAAICDSCAGVREYSVGPWQINLLAHPGVSTACAIALNCAAAAASAISGRGSNWSPWTTYTQGTYRRYLA
jgi:hypothetical protein